MREPEAALFTLSPFFLFFARLSEAASEQTNAALHSDRQKLEKGFFSSSLLPVQQGVGREVMQNRATYTWWTPTCEIGDKRRRGHLYRYHGRTNVRQTTRPIFVL